MIELLMLIGVMVIMYRIANAENLSPGLWTLLTFLVCMACGYLPLPYVRIVIGGAATYGIMFVYKLVKPERPARRVL